MGYIAPLLTGKTNWNHGCDTTGKFKSIKGKKNYPAKNQKRFQTFQEVRYRFRNKSAVDKVFAHSLTSMCTMFTCHSSKLRGGFFAFLSQKPVKSIELYIYFVSLDFVVLGRWFTVFLE